MTQAQSKIRLDSLACLLLSAWAGLIIAAGVPSAAGQTVIAYAPDITVVLNGKTIDDENAAEDDLNGNVALLETGILPANVAIEAFHRTGDPEIGDLMVLDTSVKLPGGVLATPTTIVAYRNDTFFGLDLADSCPGLRGAGIDGLTATSEGTLWLSVDQPVKLGGQVFDDEDVVAIGGGCIGETIFDGSAAGVPAGLDVDAIDYLEDSSLLLLSFDAAGSIGGIRFDDEDVLGYGKTTGLWNLVYDGSAEHPAGGWIAGDLNALAIKPGTTGGGGEPEPPLPPKARLIITPRQLAFELAQDAAPASKPFTVRAEGGTIRYSILAGASWLSAGPAGGWIAGDLNALAIKPGTTGGGWRFVRRSGYDHRHGQSERAAAGRLQAAPLCERRRQAAGRSNPRRQARFDGAWSGSRAECGCECCQHDSFRPSGTRDVAAIRGGCLRNRFHAGRVCC